ncbi:ZIP zinc/iron transport family [Exidia glandulosa HHB12029]|uniref:ZIP zinc/iron transport family n=1 Tax=Exidia glandulosa HHB12029 TaxID=1314781 RepID=A0A165E197_EXIGL|nr:ZIP zinc/iron transport family [Exidia glandulosa HHB12029]
MIDAAICDGDGCGPPDADDIFFHLRVASIFIILVTSSFGAIFPIIAAQGRWRVHPLVFEFVKFFGSGVIIATAFIHLLAPAFESLSNPCLAAGWDDYPWAPAMAMLAVFALFLVELVAYRWGTAKMTALGLSAHAFSDTQAAGMSAAHGPEPPRTTAPNDEETSVATSKKAFAAPHSHAVHADGSEDTGATVLAQLVGVAILEFGVVFHSVLIGLTLAVDPDFKILFIVIIFHQMFEGLGLGARLAYLKLPPKYRWMRLAGGILYGLTTPIGIAAGLGVRHTYAPDSATASIVSGIFDSMSAGILLYTGLVELLAHEFLFNPKIHQISNERLTFMCCCMLLGAGLMALLGRWA